MLLPTRPVWGCSERCFPVLRYVSALTVLSGVERPVLWVMVGTREAEGSQPLLLGAEGLLNVVFDAVILFFPQALGIENEDDLYKLVNFFLKYQTHHSPSSQVR